MLISKCSKIITLAGMALILAGCQQSPNPTPGTTTGDTTVAPTDATVTTPNTTTDATTTAPAPVDRTHNPPPGST